MKINEQLSNFELEVVKIIKEARIHLACLPEGELRNYPTSCNGISYDKYYILNNGNRKYIPKEDSVVKLLAEKMYYQKLLEIAKATLDELIFFRDNIPGITTPEVLGELPDWVGPLINFPRSDELLVSPDPALAKILLDWQNSPYHKKDNRNEGLRHRTSDGEYVRSKSEALIWEKIKQLQIACRYEDGIEYEPGKWIYPDITMMRTDTKLYYLEHCGLMNDPKYVSDFKWKLNVYEKIGIVPWDNLILTFDDTNGNIDMNLIEAVLKSKLII